MDPYNLANFCGNQSNGVCSRYCCFLVVAYSNNWWTAFHDVYLNDADSPKDVPLRVSMTKNNAWGQKSPKTQILGAGIGVLSQICKIFKWPYSLKVVKQLKRNFNTTFGPWVIQGYYIAIAAAVILYFLTNLNKSALISHVYIHVHMRNFTGTIERRPNDKNRHRK